MANRVRSIISASSRAGSSKLVGSSPSTITGKSSRGSVGSWKRLRPAFTVMRLSAVSRLTWLPSGSLRAISNSRWADTVIAPPLSTFAAVIVSTTCRSRSVAMTFTPPPSSASISTLLRIGMVLRRSTTDCTWDRQRSSVARSMVAFIGPSLVSCALVVRRDSPLSRPSREKILSGFLIAPALRGKEQARFCRKGWG